MIRSRMFRLTALSGLVSLSLFGVAHAAGLYNVATDWATTYPTSASMASATSATWGPGNVWSAGVFSYNWTNESNVNFSTNQNVEDLKTYYNASTAAETSGATTVATFTYTVPFHAYQLNPGTTINVATSPEVTAQSNSGFTSVTGNAVKLPTGWTATTVGTLGNNIAEVAKVAGSGFVSTENGFTTSHSGTMKDGGGTVQDQLAGAWYNYATTNAVGTGVAMQNAASGSLDNVIMLEGALGPAYVAWTAPSTSIIDISANAWDLHETGPNGDNDGYPGFAIYAGTATTLGSPLFSALNTGPSGVGTMQSYVSATVGTANSNIGALNGYPTTSTDGASFGVGWSDTSLAVSAGEVLYFISDPGHTYNGNHAFLGGADPIALQVAFHLQPEPSSIVLLGMAGVGLALAARRRRRTA